MSSRSGRGRFGTVSGNKSVGRGVQVVHPEPDNNTHPEKHEVKGKVRLQKTNTPRKGWRNVGMSSLKHEDNSKSQDIAIDDNHEVNIVPKRKRSCSEEKDNSSNKATFTKCSELEAIQANINSTGEMTSTTKSEDMTKNVGGSGSEHSHRRPGIAQFGSLRSKSDHKSGAMRLFSMSLNSIVNQASASQSSQEEMSPSSSLAHNTQLQQTNKLGDHGVKAHLGKRLDDNVEREHQESKAGDESRVSVAIKDQGSNSEVDDLAGIVDKISLQGQISADRHQRKRESEVKSAVPDLMSQHIKCNLGTVEHTRRSNMEINNSSRDQVMKKSNEVRNKEFHGDSQNKRSDIERKSFGKVVPVQEALHQISRQNSYQNSPQNTSNLNSCHESYQHSHQNTSRQNIHHNSRQNTSRQNEPQNFRQNNSNQNLSQNTYHNSSQNMHHNSSQNRHHNSSQNTYHNSSQNTYHNSIQNTQQISGRNTHHNSSQNMHRNSRQNMQQNSSQNTYQNSSRNTYQNSSQNMLQNSSQNMLQNSSQNTSYDSTSQYSHQTHDQPRNKSFGQPQPHDTQNHSSQNEANLEFLAEEDWDEEILKNSQQLCEMLAVGNSSCETKIQEETSLLNNFSKETKATDERVLGVRAHLGKRIEDTVLIKEDCGNEICKNSQQPMKSYEKSANSDQTKDFEILDKSENKFGRHFEKPKNFEKCEILSGPKNWKDMRIASSKEQKELQFSEKSKVVETKGVESSENWEYTENWDTDEMKNSGKSDVPDEQEDDKIEDEDDIAETNVNSESEPLISDLPPGRPSQNGQPSHKQERIISGPVFNSNPEQNKNNMEVKEESTEPINQPQDHRTPPPPLNQRSSLHRDHQRSRNFRPSPPLERQSSQNLRSPPPQEHQPPATQEYRPSAPQEHQPPAPQDYRPPTPQEYRPPAPEVYKDYRLPPTQDHRLWAPEDYQPPVPQEYQPPAPQDYCPWVPQEYQPPTPQEYRLPAPQEYRPLAPQEYRPPVPQEYRPPVPQEYRPPVPQDHQTMPTHDHRPQLPSNNNQDGSRSFLQLNYSNDYPPNYWNQETLHHQRKPLTINISLSQDWYEMLEKNPLISPEPAINYNRSGAGVYSPVYQASLADGNRNPSLQLNRRGSADSSNYTCMNSGTSQFPGKQTTPELSTSPPKHVQSWGSQASLVSPGCIAPDVAILCNQQKVRSSCPDMALLQQCCNSVNFLSSTSSDALQHHQYSSMNPVGTLSSDQAQHHQYSSMDLVGTSISDQAQHHQYSSVHPPAGISSSDPALPSSDPPQHYEYLSITPFDFLARDDSKQISNDINKSNISGLFTSNPKDIHKEVTYTTRRGHPPISSSPDIVSWGDTEYSLPCSSGPDSTPLSAPNASEDQKAAYGKYAKNVIEMQHVDSRVFNEGVINPKTREDLVNMEIHWQKCYEIAQKTQDETCVLWCQYYWYVHTYLPMFAKDKKKDCCQETTNQQLNASPLDETSPGRLFGTRISSQSTAGPDGFDQKEYSSRNNQNPSSYWSKNIDETGSTPNKMSKFSFALPSRSRRSVDETFGRRNLIEKTEESKNEFVGRRKSCTIVTRFRPGIDEDETFSAPIDFIGGATQFINEFNSMSKIPFIDSHCHLDLLFQRSGHTGTFEAFQRKTETFPLNYSGCVAVFCQPKAWPSYVSENGLLKCLLKEENIWAAVGCHPKNVMSYTDESEQILIDLLKLNKVKALGEIGLDYSKNFFYEADKQKEILERQLMIAQRYNKPIVIHSRESESDIVEMLQRIMPRNYKIHRHCFTGTWQEAETWLKAFPNSYIGLTPAITNFKKYPLLREVVRQLPLDRLLFETDSPYFVPKQLCFELHNSHPGFAITVAHEYAKMHRIAIEEVLVQVYKNVRYMYNIA